MSEQLEAMGVDIWYAIHRRTSSTRSSSFYAKRVGSREQFFEKLRKEQTEYGAVVEEYFDELAYWEAQK